MKDDIVKVPYAVAESIADRYDRTNKRLWAVIILLIVLLVGSNALWIWYESQFVYYQEVEQEIDSGDGITTVIGIGDHYGNSKTDR